MDLEISVKSYRCMLRIQAARASHVRARNMIFHKGLKKVFIQLLNPIKNTFFGKPLYQLFTYVSQGRTRARKIAPKVMSKIAINLRNLTAICLARCLAEKQKSQRYLR